MFPMASTRISKLLSAAHCRIQSRVSLSSGVSACRSTPLFSVAPIVATKWKSVRKAASLEGDDCWFIAGHFLLLGVAYGADSASSQPTAGLRQAGDEDEDEADCGTCGHIEAGRGVDAGEPDEPGAHERCGAAENGIGDVVADRSRGEARLRREPLAEEGVAASAVTAECEDEDRLTEERQRHVPTGYEPERRHRG